MAMEHSTTERADTAEHTYDAVIIPGGGITPVGGLPEWTRRRLEKALEHTAETRFFICLSAGTFHKPLPRDTDGFAIFESVLAAQYLRQKGIEESRILYETCSYDTLGNAYFARVIHTDPLQLRRLNVITSAFHLPRTQAIFESVFALENENTGYELSFAAVSDEGLDAAMIAARTEREQASLVQFRERSQRVNNLQDLHRWLFADHNAYRLAGQREALNASVLASY